MPDGYSYKLTVEAEKEYLESFLWYEERKEGLGEQFAAAVRKKLALISINPYLFRKKKGLFHEVTLGKTFPFVIVYVVEKKLKQIVITAIFHTSRNPGKKYRRK
jgi:plasmid stabilization system protein ParE